ncbi:UbiA family prenyltransferase [Candidatus Sumerlaeota bacterium]|nr:UbiA family prenyltransferase [Candidatus Sumerlaeota bacterium]
MKDYILHLRPRSWLIVGLHFAVGGVVAASAGLFVDYRWLVLIAGAIIWAVLLNGGTLAFNSAFDKDTTDIGYLDNPPFPPPGLGWFGFWWMVVGLVIVALFFNTVFLSLYSICLVMSVLYSCPPLRLKAIAGSDIIINSAGYGALTFAGGYAAMNGELSTGAVVLAVGFAFLFATFYPLTQIYQYRYDHQRGDRTFTVWLTPQRALRFCTVMLFISFAFFIYGMIRWRAHIFSAFLLLSAFVLWLSLLIRWMRHFDTFPHKKGMYDALYLWGFVDLIVILIFSGV